MPSILQAFSEQFKILPWQMKSILIMFEVPPKMLCFALICRVYQSLSYAPNSVTEIRNGTKCGKLMPPIVVEIEDSYYRNILEYSII